MCDTMVTVEPHRVLFAKNSDRDPNEAQILDWQPRRIYPPGSTVSCTWIGIPQVRATNAVLLSRPFWMWGAEMGANEHGLVIGNEAVFTRQPHAKIGLTGMDILRLALERGGDAESAVRVIVELLETHGQGGGCGHENRRFTYHNSFLVADPTRAIVLETAGRFWATDEVRGRRSISNGLTIPGFAEKHGDRAKTWASGCRLRRERTQSLIESATDPAVLASILRDHGEGRTVPQYTVINGGLVAPCVHPGGVFASSQTTGSWIAELTPRSVRHWATGTAAPCCSLFKPVRVDQPLDLGPSPTDLADEQSLWWRGERLHRLLLRNAEKWLPRFASERVGVESAWFCDPPDSRVAFDLADAFTRRWREIVVAESAIGEVTDVRPPRVQRYWNTRNRRAGFERVYPRMHALVSK